MYVCTRYVNAVQHKAKQHSQTHSIAFLCCHVYKFSPPAFVVYVLLIIMILFLHFFCIVVIVTAAVVAADTDICI